MNRIPREKKYPKISRSRAEQKRAQDTRQAVLEAAVQEFAQSGFSGARVEAITEAAGVNKQALYYHFGSKEDLFAAVLGSAYDRFLPEDGPWNDPQRSVDTAMRQLIGTIFDHFATHRDEIAIIAEQNRYGITPLTPALKRRMRGGVTSTIKAIKSVLERGQSQRIFEHHITPIQLYMTVIALSFFYFTNAYTMSGLLGQDLMRGALVRSWRQHVIDFILAALAAKT